MDPRVEKIMKAAEYIAAKLDGRKPFAGIVLGSGLGKLADKIENPIVIPYKDIPGFPVSTAVGHKGNFIAGELGGKFVVAMQGRFHYYEGYPMELVTLPIRVMKVLGIQYLFVSNAAGGVNFDFKVGDLMGDNFLFYVNEWPTQADENGNLVVTVKGYMLIRALGFKSDAADTVEEKLNFFEKLIKAIKEFFDMLFGWMK